jgi:hypothetical protein
MRFTTPSKEKVLQAALQALSQGDSLDEILERYPAHAESLRPHLQSAQWLAQQHPTLEPSPAFIQASHQRLLADLRRRASPRMRFWRRFQQGWGYFSRGFQAAVIAVFILALFHVSAQVLFAARTALPGDLLYSLKLFPEQLQLAFTLDPIQDARLNILHAQTRTLELQELLFEGRYENLPQGVNLFQKELSRAQVSLLRVERTDPQLAHLMHYDMQQTLRDQVFILSLLMESIPRGLRAGLEQALLAAPH